MSRRLRRIQALSGRWKLAALGAFASGVLLFVSAYGLVATDVSRSRWRPKRTRG